MHCRSGGNAGRNHAGLHRAQGHMGHRGVRAQRPMRHVHDEQHVQHGVAACGWKPSCVGAQVLHRYSGGRVGAMWGATWGGAKQVHVHATLAAVPRVLKGQSPDHGSLHERHPSKVTHCQQRHTSLMYSTIISSAQTQSHQLKRTHITHSAPCQRACTPTGPAQQPDPCH